MKIKKTSLVGVSRYGQMLRMAVLVSFALAAASLPAHDIAGSNPSVVVARSHYLPPGRPDSTVLLPPPPSAGSDEQAGDMAAVVAAHKACTTSEADKAFSEKKFSIFNFAPAIGPFFQPGKFPKTETFFERVQKDAAAATDSAKFFWKRPRPFVTDPSLGSGQLEKSFSYPSGHSAESTVLALVLAELFPDRRDEILAISRDIGWHRVQIARHYPTDIYAGRVFARAIVREMKNNLKFQRDLAAARNEIKAAEESGAAETSTAHAALN